MICGLALIGLLAAVSNGYAQPVKIIVDTDMLTDPEDVNLAFATEATVCPASPATPPAKEREVIRRFRAEVVAVDALRGTVTVVHALTGYRFTARITEKTRLAQTRFFDRSEIPQGSIVETWGQIDVGARRVRAGECQVQSASRSPASWPGLCPCGYGCRRNWCSWASRCG